LHIQRASNLRPQCGIPTELRAHVLACKDHTIPEECTAIWMDVVLRAVPSVGHCVFKYQLCAASHISRRIPVTTRGCLAVFSMSAPRTTLQALTLGALGVVLCPYPARPSGASVRRFSPLPVLLSSSIRSCSLPVLARVSSLLGLAFFVLARNCGQKLSCTATSQ